MLFFLFERNDISVKNTMYTRGVLKLLLFFHVNSKTKYILYRIINVAHMKDYHSDIDFIAELHSIRLCPILESIYTP